MTNTKKQVAMIKKLSTAKILGEKPRLNRDEKERALYQVVGVANGIKTGTTDYGDWLAFRGNFAAINLETGEQKRSAVLFLPDVAGDMILGQMGSDVQGVEFGFEIGILEDDSTPTGYVYTAKSLIQPDENDPLEMLMNSAGSFALEHKPEETEPEEVPEETPAKKTTKKTAAKKETAAA